MRSGTAGNQKSLKGGDDFKGCKLTRALLFPEVFLGRYTMEKVLNAHLSLSEQAPQTECPHGSNTERKRGAPARQIRQARETRSGTLKLI